WLTRLPSGRRPTMSVKVPPRSIQNCHRPSCVTASPAISRSCSCSALPRTRSAATRRIAGQASGLEVAQVVRPETLLLLTQLVEVIPGKDARIMQIIEHDLYRIAADRLDGHDAHVPAPGDDLLLAGTVSLNFCRGAFDAQQLRRQRDALPV